MTITFKTKPCVEQQNEQESFRDDKYAGVQKDLNLVYTSSRSTPLSLVGAQAEPFSLPGDFKTVKLVKLGKGKKERKILAIARNRIIKYFTKLHMRAHL